MKKAVNKLNKIYIMSAVASGKTTLARKISHHIHIQHYNLDDIYWKRKYDLHYSDKECRKRLEKLVRKKEWIIEGTFSRWIEPAIKKAQLVIYLDLPFNILAYRLIKRFIIKKMKNPRKSPDKLKDHVVMLKENYEFTSRKHMQKNKEAWAYIKRNLLASLIEKYKTPYIHLKTMKEIRQFVNNL